MKSFNKAFRITHASHKSINLKRFYMSGLSYCDKGIFGYEKNIDDGCIFYSYCDW